MFSYTAFLFCTDLTRGQISPITSYCLSTHAVPSHIQYHMGGPVSLNPTLNRSLWNLKIFVTSFIEIVSQCLLWTVSRADWFTSCSVVYTRNRYSCSFQQSAIVLTRAQTQVLPTQLFELPGTYSEVWRLALHHLVCGWNSTNSLQLGHVFMP